MIRENVEQILEELPAGVELVAAAKTRTPEEILEAAEAGVRIMGENYIQEAERAFDAVGDHVEIEQRLMGGFFAAGDYVGIHKTDVYEDEWLSLDRFAVIEPDACWQLFNWTQYYTPESAVAELAEGGFMVAAMTGGLDGTPLADDSQVLGIIAEAS